MSAMASGGVQTASEVILTAIFVSSSYPVTWLITSLSPGNGEKMSKHSIESDEWRALLDHFPDAAGEGAGSNWQDLPDHRHP